MLDVKRKMGHNVSGELECVSVFFVTTLQTRLMHSRYIAKFCCPLVYRRSALLTSPSQ